MSGPNSSYEFFKKGGAKEIPFNELPKEYGWVTGDGGDDGWYYNFFMKDEDLIPGFLDPKKAFMCKIKKL